ncbi:MAG: cysteine hydrolase family protein [Nitrososphaerales archaeon]
MPSSNDTALIVIDMQNDFCSVGGGMDRRGYNISYSQTIIPAIASMLRICRAHEIKVFFVRGENSPMTTSPSWENRPSAKHDKNLGFRLIEPGSWGAQIVDELRPLPNEPVIVKTRYSAFINTELPFLLRNAGITNIIFTGMTTNVCVETCARDAFVMDFNVIVASNCVASPEPELAVASLKTIAKYFGRVDKSEAILADLIPAAPLVES